MIDIHVHFGQFYDKYYDPEKVIEDLIKMGVAQIGLMPTLTKKGDNVMESHQIMMRIHKKYNKQIIPILWIHPKTKEKDILIMLNDLPYQIIKVHGYFHDWHKYPKSLLTIISIARLKQLPIMFHTGGRKESFAFAYKSICKNNPDITFILAHSRPVKGTINVMQECKNVYCDISFTPIKDVLLLKASNLMNRILWGTDYPVYSAFNQSIDINQWYQNRCDQIRTAVGQINFDIITKTNFLNLYQPTQPSTMAGH